MNLASCSHTHLVINRLGNLPIEGMQRQLKVTITASVYEINNTCRPKEKYIYIYLLI